MPTIRPIAKGAVSKLRNFPMQKGRPVKGKPTVYASVQEPFLGAPPPKFRIVPSFNYGAAAA